MRATVIRVLLAGALGVAALVGLMLLVRPAIFTVAEPRGDANLGVATLEELRAGPLTRPILLTRSYGLLGERPRGRRAEISLLVVPLPGGTAAVLNAASPVDPCPVAPSRDASRLEDCGGRTWSLEGEPLSPGGAAQPALQRFAARVEAGAVTADLTHPVSGPGAE